ncbi:MAG: RecQ family ATP-dependent DNA helicase, partial [Armatimonadetes bacterium]|nr:RecQ family ATP-dependent DNA helicase [Armatimonadota bacterium]
IAAARLDSTLAASEAREIYGQMEAGTLKLLYVAPERFNNERFLALLKRTPIALLAVDEAHCISEWGHNFRPDYLKLAQTARDLKVARVLALTATATPSVVKDICEAFRIPAGDATVTGFYRPNLNVCLTPVRAEDRDALLVRRLGARRAGPTIVYVTLQKTAGRLAAYLTAQGFPAEAYHAGMDDELRAQVQDRWMASDAGIVVATIAFGMGIDKANVRYVYHYNLPKSLESYSQEIGRAGRDGAKSTVEMLACPDDVPTLENFAHGDTPTESALHGLLTELLAQGPEFDVSVYDLSFRHDIRMLVLRTALTYLELRGVLRQGTPFYAGYEVQPLRPLQEITGEFAGPHGRFVADIFAHARRGTKWYALNPDDIAAALDVDRRRVVRALEYLEERGWAQVRASDVRQRYTRLRESEDIEALVAELRGRFEKREAQEQARLQQVLDLVTHDGCQANALVGYFGETRSAPCGHCTHCATGRTAILPPAYEAPPIETLLDLAEWQALRAAHPAALGEARQAARFLCGLGSPALMRAKLTKHPLFGTLEAMRFGDVLAWCEN